MRDFARRSEGDRRDLFRATAQTMRVSEAIVEKDFWVCWILDYLFNNSPWQFDIAFKGGTSLSKAYAAIQRFSEDVDLILNWTLLGFDPGELLKKRSVNKQAELNKQANERCAEFLGKKFIHTIRDSLSEIAGQKIEVEIDKEDSQSVLIQYPRTFSLAAIRPEIILEVGPLAAWAPNEPKEIRPYASEKFPDLFKQKMTIVSTVVAERTFWEKATILHQEAHRPENKQLPSRHSRHYYDLYRLSLLPVRDRAFAQLDLLERVAVFKDKFYHSAWARYDTAKSGSFRLTPSEYHLQELKKDYESMQPMLFGNVPSFEDILIGLDSLEEQINAL